MKLKKVKYPCEPHLEPSKNGHKFELIDYFPVFIDGVRVDIPAGFWTDLASTGIFSPLNASMKAAITHDYLYYKQELYRKPITRAEADYIFYLGMKTCKFKLAYIYYLGVRVGGWKVWNKYKNDRIKNKGATK